MAEYQMVKCCACGRKMRGPRIARLPKEEKKEYKTIKKKEGELDGIRTLMVFMYMGLIGLVIILCSLFFPTFFMKGVLKSMMDQPFLCLLIIFFICIVPICYFLRIYKKKEMAFLEERRRKILKRYNIKKNAKEGDDFVIK